MPRLVRHACRLSSARTAAGVPSFIGQVWDTCTGFMRWLFSAVDKRIAAMATDVWLVVPRIEVF